MEGKVNMFKNMNAGKNEKNNDLQKLLDERNKIIEDLKRENKKLEIELKEYRTIGTSIAEFQQIVKTSKAMNAELEDLKKEYLKMNRDYKRDMGRFFKKQKM